MNLGKVGKLGEDLACLFLKKQLFNIKERNFYTKFGEIDIIAEKLDTLHFIEVKAVSCEIRGNLPIINGLVSPEENIHKFKLDNLSKVVQIYLSKKESYEKDWQFDALLVYIDFNAKKSLVNFLENQILSQKN